MSLQQHKKSEDQGLIRADEQIPPDAASENQPTPEFDVFGTALNEI